MRRIRITRKPYTFTESLHLSASMSKVFRQNLIILNSLTMKKFEREKEMLVRRLELNNRLCKILQTKPQPKKRKLSLKGNVFRKNKLLKNFS